MAKKLIDRVRIALRVEQLKTVQRIGKPRITYYKGPLYATILVPPEGREDLVGKVIRIQ